MENISLQPGDVLRRKKGPVWHWGVCLAEGILHNTPDSGEHLSSLSEFANGQNIEVFHSDNIYREEIIARAYRIIYNPSSYQYLWRNCEHTLTEITKGQPSSHTVRNFATLALVFSGIYISIKYRAQLAQTMRYIV